jgi:hypothetical protein
MWRNLVILIVISSLPMLDDNISQIDQILQQALVGEQVFVSEPTGSSLVSHRICSKFFIDLLSLCGDMIWLGIGRLDRMRHLYMLVYAKSAKSVVDAVQMTRGRPPWPHFLVVSRLLGAERGVEQLLEGCV